MSAKVCVFRCGTTPNSAAPNKALNCRAPHSGAPHQALNRKVPNSAAPNPRRSPQRGSSLTCESASPASNRRTAQHHRRPPPRASKAQATQGILTSESDSAHYKAPHKATKYRTTQCSKTTQSQRTAPNWCVISLSARIGIYIFFWNWVG